MLCKKQKSKQNKERGNIMNEFERLNNLDEYTAFESELESMGEKERAPYVPSKPMTEADIRFNEAYFNKKNITCRVCGQLVSRNDCHFYDEETHNGYCKECDTTLKKNGLSAWDVTYHNAYTDETKYSVVIASDFATADREAENNSEKYFVATVKPISNFVFKQGV